MDVCSSPKVLLLGISYPDVEGHMEEHCYDADILQHSELSVDQAVECVRRKILTEMDGRDLARCVATEGAGGGHEVYTVSKEMGGIYRKDRHVYASFNNSRGMRRAMSKAFGHVRFQQVILDYYWMPTGWLVTRWNKTLFQETLPDLVKYDMLAYPGSRQKSPRKGRIKKSGNRSDIEKKHNPNDLELEEGVVFLPFCAHVCKELVGGIDKLKQYFAITFVKKSELPGHALWKGTMSIDGRIMQERLGKRLDQEEVYCTFQPKDIYESMEDAHVNKDEVMQMLLSIEDFENIRMIRLRPLRQHEPPSVFKERAVAPETGGFIGLDWKKGRQRFKEFRRRRNKTPVVAPPPPTKPKAVPKVVEVETDSDSEIETDCGDTDTDTDTDSDSSSDEDDDAAEAIAVNSDGEPYKDFDPCDPDKVPAITHYFPFPALDLESYMINKDVEANDRVMAFYDKTWGPKSSRRKNKKQDVAKEDFQRFQKTQRDYLERNPRLPCGETKEGYTWTLHDGYTSEKSNGDESDNNDDDSSCNSNIRKDNDMFHKTPGWKLSLKGDDPGAHLVPRIIELAKRDNEMHACRQLFEMRNPGFKTFERTWTNNKTYLSCYKIPGNAVHEKIWKAEEVQKKWLREQKARKKELEKLNEEAPEKQKEEEVVSENYDDGSDGEDSVVSVGAEIDGAASVVSCDDPLPTDLLRLADVATTTPLLCEDFRSLCKESKGVLATNNGEHYKPFVPRSVPKAQQYNLSPHENFPRELFRLLNDAEGKILDHVLCWQERGRSFIVKDPDGFTSLVAGRYCDPPGVTYQSFLGTILSYGFDEIRIGSRKGGYRHNLFQRGKPKRLDRLIEEGPMDLLVDATPAVTKRRTRNPTRGAGLGDGSTKQQQPRKVFLANLYQLLRNARVLGFEDILYWEDSGESFRVHKLNQRFKNLILKTHLSLDGYVAFKRELLDRGFHCRDGAKYGVFQHEKFLRGRRCVSETFDDIPLTTRRKRILEEPKPAATAKKPRLKPSESPTTAVSTNSTVDNSQSPTTDTSSSENNKPKQVSEASDESTSSEKKDDSEESDASSSSEKTNQNEDSEASDAPTRSHQAKARAKIASAVPDAIVSSPKKRGRQRAEKDTESADNVDLFSKSKTKSKVKKPCKPSRSSGISRRGDEANELDTEDTPEAREAPKKTRKMKSVTKKSSRGRPKKTKKTKSVKTNFASKILFKRTPDFKDILYRILEDSDEKGYSEFIRWVPEGDGFFIAEESSFEENFLQEFTRIKYFPSFMNYLNWFGFKTTDRDDGTVFRHHYFCRGDKDKLALMKPDKKFVFPHHSSKCQEEQTSNAVKLPRAIVRDGESETTKTRTKGTKSTRTETKEPKSVPPEIPNSSVKAIRFPRAIAGDDESDMANSSRTETKEPKSVPREIPNSTIAPTRSSATQPEPLVVSPPVEETTNQTIAVSISPQDKPSMADTSTIPRRTDSREIKPGMLDSSPDLSTRRLFSSPKDDEAKKSTKASANPRSRATKTDTEHGRKRKVDSAIASPKSKKIRSKSTGRKKTIVAETPEAFVPRLERTTPIVGEMPDAFVPRHGPRHKQEGDITQKAILMNSIQRNTEASMPRRVTLEGDIINQKAAPRVTKATPPSNLPKSPASRRGVEKSPSSGRGLQKRSRTTKVRGSSRKKSPTTTTLSTFPRSKMIEDKISGATRTSNSTSGLMSLPSPFPVVRSIVGQIADSTLQVTEHGMNELWTEAAHRNHPMPTAAVTPPMLSELIPSESEIQNLLSIGLTPELVLDIISIYKAKVGVNRAFSLGKIILWHAKIDAEDSEEIKLISMLVRAVNEDKEINVFVRICLCLQTEFCMFALRSKFGNLWFDQHLSDAVGEVNIVLELAVTEITKLSKEIGQCYGNHVVRAQALALQQQEEAHLREQQQELALRDQQDLGLQQLIHEHKQRIMDLRFTLNEKLRERDELLRGLHSPASENNTNNGSISNNNNNINHPGQLIASEIDNATKMMLLRHPHRVLQAQALQDSRHEALSPAALRNYGSPTRQAQALQGSRHEALSPAALRNYRSPTRLP